MSIICLPDLMWLFIMSGRSLCDWYVCLCWMHVCLCWIYVCLSLMYVYLCWMYVCWLTVEEEGWSCLYKNIRV